MTRRTRGHKGATAQERAARAKRKRLKARERQRERRRRREAGLVMVRAEVNEALLWPMLGGIKPPVVESG